MSQTRTGNLGLPLGYDTNDGCLEPEIINTRFGKIELERHKSFYFPSGLLGMANKREFFIANFPNDKLSKFRLLQSIDDYNLSFITLPVLIDNELIEKSDIISACEELDIETKNLVILLIVSVHRSPLGVSISVNTRAPLLIDSYMRVAAQYVFGNDKYKVQHYIS